MAVSYTWSISIIGMALELKQVVETNRVSWHCIICYFHSNTCLKFKTIAHSYISNKVEWFTYKGGCCVTGINMLKCTLMILSGTM